MSLLQLEWAEKLANICIKGLQPVTVWKLRRANIDAT
jgi:hypothetical protein